MLSPGLMVCGLMLNEVMPTAGALACGGTVGNGVTGGTFGVDVAPLPGALVLVSEAKGVELAWLSGGVLLAVWLALGSGVRLAGGVSVDVAVTMEMAVEDAGPAVEVPGAVAVTSAAMGGGLATTQ